MATVTRRLVGRNRPAAPQGGPGWTPVWVTSNFTFKDPFLTGMPLTPANKTWLCPSKLRFDRLMRETRPFIRLASDEEIVRAGGKPPVAVDTDEPDTAATETLTAQAGDIASSRTDSPKKPGSRSSRRK